jgi:hypothetical protein
MRKRNETSQGVLLSCCILQLFSSPSTLRARTRQPVQRYENVENHQQQCNAIFIMMELKLFLLFYFQVVEEKKDKNRRKRRRIKWNVVRIFNMFCVLCWIWFHFKMKYNTTKKSRGSILVSRVALFYMKIFHFSLYMCWSFFFFLLFISYSFVPSSFRTRKKIMFSYASFLLLECVAEDTRKR